MSRSLSRTKQPPQPATPSPKLPITGAEIANRVADRITGDGMSLADLTGLACGLAWAHGLLAGRLASQAGVPAGDFRAASEAIREQWLCGVSAALEATAKTARVRAVKRIARTHRLDSSDAPSGPQSDAGNEVAA